MLITEPQSVNFHTTAVLKFITIFTNWIWQIIFIWLLQSQYTTNSTRANLHITFQVTPTSPTIRFSDCIFMQSWYPRYTSQSIRAPLFFFFFGGSTAQIRARTPTFLRIFSLSFTCIHTVCLLWTSDQLVAKATTYTEKHNRRTSDPSEGFKLAMAATKRIQNHAFGRTTTGMDPGFDNPHITSGRIQVIKFSVLLQYPLQHMFLPPHQFLRQTYYITRGT